MAPDLAVADDNHELSFDPDSPKNSFWNRLASSTAPKLFDKPLFDAQANSTHNGDASLVKSQDQSPPKRRPSRPAISDLKRPLTFARQVSETRERLKACDLTVAERRQASGANRRRRSTTGHASPVRQPATQRSAPEMRGPARDVYSPNANALHTTVLEPPESAIADLPTQVSVPFPDLAPPLLSPRSSLGDERLSRHSSHLSDGLNDPAFWAELDARWILNLSMAFRDNSEREKFFITYAKEPNRWLRVTVSVDYRNKPPDSLEADLKTLPFQRDKSAHIYEAIHESLSSVQFYQTVTNLKLETSEGRLHVHVTEDLNEIIKYPPLDAVGHLESINFQEVVESDIHFLSHQSGFVYKVSVYGRSCIKKEIPGPDMIDEFLYEVNALWNLKESQHVIDFCAIVLDDKRTCIKGLLISYADKGTLVDVIYDNRDPPLPWTKRDKWARQIVAGLADIHEQGFVQGDFTLSNIVIDSNDNARIIDINRRGCPVGWEPPEFHGLIGSGQRISMYIGTKSDLYQLGMVLWALAVLDDEPERVVNELSLEGTHCGAPSYMVKWVASCLSKNPRNRLSAKELLSQLSVRNDTYQPAFDLSAMQHASLDVPAGMLQSGDSGPDGDWESVEPYAHQLAREHPRSNADLPAQAWPILKSPHYQREFLPPLHQDSGLAGMEDIPPHVHPVHQDSGIDDCFLSGELGTPVYNSNSTRRLHGSATSELASAGAQFG